MSAAIRLATNEPAHNDNPRAPGMSAVRRPALRYHGGKFMLAGWIISNMPTHRTYVEPFAGACSVLLRKTRTYAEVANDLNLKIYDYFKVLRDPSSYAQLKRALQFTPFHEREFRLSLEDCDDPIEQARRLCVRSFLSHGSDGVTSSTVPGYRCEIYDDMLSDWVRLDTRAQADGNAKKTESLWLNPAAADNRPSPSLFGV